MGKTKKTQFPTSEEINVMSDGALNTLIQQVLVQLVGKYNHVYDPLALYTDHIDHARHLLNQIGIVTNQEWSEGRSDYDWKKRSITIMTRMGTKEYERTRSMDKFPNADTRAYSEIALMWLIDLVVN